MNLNKKINIGDYREKSYYAEKRGVVGVGFGNSKTDVQIKKKEPAKPKHGVLIAVAIVGGIIYLSTKLDERF